MPRSVLQLTATVGVLPSLRGTLEPRGFHGLVPAEGMGWEGPRGDWDLWRIRGITQGLQGAAGTQEGSAGYQGEGGAVFLLCLSSGGKNPNWKSPFSCSFSVALSGLGTSRSFVPQGSDS